MKVLFKKNMNEWRDSGYRVLNLYGVSPYSLTQLADIVTLSTDSVKFIDENSNAYGSLTATDFFGRTVIAIVSTDSQRPKFIFSNNDVRTVVVTPRKIYVPVKERGSVLVAPFPPGDQLCQRLMASDCPFEYVVDNSDFTEFSDLVHNNMYNMTTSLSAIHSALDSLTRLAREPDEEEPFYGLTEEVQHMFRTVLPLRHLLRFKRVGRARRLVHTPRRVGRTTQGPRRVGDPWWYVQTIKAYILHSPELVPKIVYDMRLFTIRDGKIDLKKFESFMMAPLDCKLSKLVKEFIDNKNKSDIADRIFSHI